MTRTLRASLRLAAALATGFAGPLACNPNGDTFTPSSTPPKDGAGSADLPAGVPDSDQGMSPAARDLSAPSMPDASLPPLPPSDMAVKPPVDLAMNPPPTDMAVKPPVADMAVKPPVADMAVKPPVVDMAVKPPVDMAIKPPIDMAMPSGVDPFGVKEVYPTAANGREWVLPATADQPDAEWQPGTTVTKIAAGLFEVTGAPRMMVKSPAGKAWWRNVEMTAYLRETGTVNFYQDQVPHWELFARGEAHTNDFISPQSINGGVTAPFGTATWPGYPFNGLQTINQSCLASCYHGHAYPDGKVLFEKEISHIEGYVFGIAQQNVPNFQSAMNRWFGYKFIVRNEKADSQVHLEIWVDENDTGNWLKATEADDTGNLISANPNMNGCGAAPTNYKTNQIVTWAGPWVSFRVDNMTYQFKALSVREINPLP